MRIPSLPSLPPSVIHEVRRKGRSLLRLPQVGVIEIRELSPSSLHLLGLLHIGEGLSAADEEMRTSVQKGTPLQKLEYLDSLPILQQAMHRIRLNSTYSVVKGGSKSTKGDLDLFPQPNKVILPCLILNKELRILSSF
jgi:hypothetical protein